MVAAVTAGPAEWQEWASEVGAARQLPPQPAIPTARPISQPLLRVPQPLRSAAGGMQLTTVQEASFPQEEEAEEVEEAKEAEEAPLLQFDAELDEELTASGAVDRPDGGGRAGESVAEWGGEGVRG